MEYRFRSSQDAITFITRSLALTKLVFFHFFCKPCKHYVLNTVHKKSGDKPCGFSRRYLFPTQVKGNGKSSEYRKWVGPFPTALKGKSVTAFLFCIPARDCSLCLLCKK